MEPGAGVEPAYSGSAPFGHPGPTLLNPIVLKENKALDDDTILV